MTDSVQAHPLIGQLLAAAEQGNLTRNDLHLLGSAALAVGGLLQVPSFLDPAQPGDTTEDQVGRTFLRSLRAFATGEEAS